MMHTIRSICAFASHVSASLTLSILLAACSTQPSTTTTDTRGLPEGNVLPADKATVVTYPVSDADDPWLSFNRSIYRFNDASYRYVMIPVASVYNRTPEQLRSSVRRLFANLKSPQLVVNHLLQGDPAAAGKSLLRFVINSTIGVVGIFDPAASAFELQAQGTGFDDTLQHYGTARGPFVMLPLLGPADVRSSVGIVVDLLLNPLPLFTEQPATALISAFDIEQTFAQQSERYQILRDESDDPYRYFRNNYLQGQLRDAQYNTGDNNPQNTP